MAAAKAYAAAWDVPLFGVNHLAGHVAADTLEHGPLPTPSLALLVSGGHTQLLRVDDLAGEITEIGTTIDDAAGEAYDKVARLLGLGYPGGPGDRQTGRRRRSDRPSPFPRGLTGPRDSSYDFSFSGLKTAVARLRRGRAAGRRGRSTSPTCARPSRRRWSTCSPPRPCGRPADLGIATVVIAGGVAANAGLRALAERRCAAAGLTLRVPRPGLCTDNGAMIAAVGAHVAAGGGAPSGPLLTGDPGLPVSTVAVN